MMHQAIHESNPASTHRHQYREAWLDSAMEYVRPLFEGAGYNVPNNIRIGVGWPSRGGTSVKKRRIGEAWANRCSADSSHEIIISIWLANPVDVLATLIHEVAHVVVGLEHGHRKPFADCVRAVGLDGKPTATHAGDALAERMAGWMDELGPYPHARLDGADKPKKQTTRMLKLECIECGAKVRTTAKWIDAYGDSWPCPCGHRLVADTPGDA